MTLTSLWGWASNLKDLYGLNLFSTIDGFLSLSVFDLDLCTHFLYLPSLFMHYLEKRMMASKEGILVAFSEVEYLGYYLKHTNFPMIQLKEENPPTMLFLPMFTKEFDDYYVYGKSAPQLRVQEEILQMINVLEALHNPGLTKISSMLLDIPFEQRSILKDKVMEKISATNFDSQLHHFSLYLEDPLNFGVTFLCKSGRNSLREKLYEIAMIVKYKNKANRWLAIGKDILDNEWFMDEFMYIESEWVKDNQMDEIVRNSLRI